MRAPALTGRAHFFTMPHISEREEAGMAVDIIRISHLVKEFKTANGVVHALDDVNLSIRHGEIYGIIGLSGA